jgi:hypothetical protein
MTESKSTSGPRASPARAQKANAEAFELLRVLLPFNLPRAAEYIRDNPPSPDAIVTIAFLAYDVLTRERERANARRPRSGLRQQIRDAGIKRFAEVKTKAPQLLVGRDKHQLTDAIAKANRKRE